MGRWRNLEQERQRETGVREKGMESIGKNQATIDINSLQPAAEPASPAERHAAGGCGEGVCGKS